MHLVGIFSEGVRSSAARYFSVFLALLLHLLLSDTILGQISSAPTQGNRDSVESASENHALLLDYRRRQHCHRSRDLTHRVLDWRDPTRHRNLPVHLYFPNDSPLPCPVVLLSHGFGSSSERCSYLGWHWAANGYAAVLIHHPGSDESIWKGKFFPMQSLRDHYRHQRSGRQRVDDVRFVLDRLETYAEESPEFGEKVNLSCIAVAGYDLGALGSLILAGQTPPGRRTAEPDPRIRALIAMSPPVLPSPHPSQVYPMVSVPSLFIRGTEDDGIVGDTKAWQRRIPFDHCSSKAKYLLTLFGADHMVYGGHFLESRSENDRRYQSLICRFSTLFLDAHLKDDPLALGLLETGQCHSMVRGWGRLERHLQIETPGRSFSEKKPSVTPETASREASSPGVSQ